MLVDEQHASLIKEKDAKITSLHQNIEVLQNDVYLRDQQQVCLLNGLVCLFNDFVCSMGLQLHQLLRYILVSTSVFVFDGTLMLDYLTHHSKCPQICGAHHQFHTSHCQSPTSFSQ